ncbi:MAG: hypothetical protein L0Y44_05690 [Phycisphaerales bacterium]|nr:hypothetical protein [Phycisphaerales bacterium]MCI0630130.1 hypothetical protein [Phycisphaerales bacterium]MCI0675929.1 hypothetical protein [Phycisphaerales bacterium]
MNTHKNILAALTVSALINSLSFATDSQPAAGPTDDSDAGVPAPRQGDINGDGMVNIDDVWLVIEAWGDYAYRPRADIFPAQGDNRVDGLDLFMVISNWGA